MTEIIIWFDNLTFVWKCVAFLLLTPGLLAVIGFMTVMIEPSAGTIADGEITGNKIRDTLTVFRSCFKIGIVISVWLVVLGLSTIFYTFVLNWPFLDAMLPGVFTGIGIAFMLVFLLSWLDYDKPAPKDKDSKQRKRTR